jgi:3-oxoadipate enol-lactonase
VERPYRERRLSTGIASLALMAMMERWFTPAFRRPENARPISPAIAGHADPAVRRPATPPACTAVRDADSYGETAASAFPCRRSCVVGDQDGSTPPELVRGPWRSLFRARATRSSPDAGHIPCVEQPAVLSALITRLHRH